MQEKFPDTSFENDVIEIDTAVSGSEMQNLQYNKAVTKIENYNQFLDQIDTVTTNNQNSASKLNNTKAALNESLRRMNSEDTSAYNLETLKNMLKANDGEASFTREQAAELNQSIQNFMERVSKASTKIDELIAAAPESETIETSTEEIFTEEVPPVKDENQVFLDSIESDLLALSEPRASLDERVTNLVKLAKKLANAPEGIDLKDSPALNTINKAKAPVEMELRRILDRNDKKLPLSQADSDFVKRTAKPYKLAMQVVELKS